MVDWLLVWGATSLVFKPILESLAKDVAKDVAKSYVGKCFKSVFSVIHKDSLTKATGLALKELLELIENELVRADKGEDEIRGYIKDVRRFIQRADVRDAIAALCLDPDYQLDPKTFAGNWRDMKDAKVLPDGFSWQFISKQFAKKVADIRHSSADLQETFASLMSERSATAQIELAGLPPGFDLDTYREALLERYGNLDFASLDTSGAYYSNVRLWSVFTPQSVRECHEYDPQLLEIPKEHLLRLVEKGELDPEQLAEAEKLADLEELREERRRAYVNQSPRPVFDVTDDTTIQRLVVLGDPGAGKSSLLRYLALQWARIADANRRYTEPLPLLIELREYNRWQCSKGKSFPKYLHEASTWHRLNQQTLKHLLEQPERVVLMLDGLDEVFDPSEREQVVNDIHRFSNAYKHVRVIVTTRVVGYKPQRLRDADFRHFMLQDLDPDQIGAFLERWHEVTFDKPEDGAAKRDRLAKAIENSKSIAQLAGNPLLLTMMAVLNRHQELPRDRADLYQQCARLLLHQWDTERGLRDFPALRGQVDLRAKIDILQSIAQHMQTSPTGLSGNIIDGKTLTGLIEDYLRSELHFDQSREAANVLVTQLRERNFILCYLGAGSYAFVHRTFLEYFCAAEIVHRFNVAKTLDQKGLIVLFDAHCADDDWREVLRLVCGQIDEQFVGRIVEHLATRTNLEEWSGKTQLPELPLAIECLSEARNATRLEKSGFALLKQVTAYIVKYWYYGKENLMSAVREIGAKWPGREWLHTQIHSVPPEIERGGLLLWPRLVAHVLSDRSISESYVDQAQLASNLNTEFFRRSALEALAEKWPDDKTRECLQERAIEDDTGDVRNAALLALTEKWPDDRTRELLQKRAVEDDDWGVRYEALLALSYQWPDEETREFLQERAVEDDSERVRRTALGKLVREWPDDKTREFLQERAVEDDCADVRGTALRALAEKWTDDNTRKLLQERAHEDNGQIVRSVALEALSEKWPDDKTREFLQERAVEDDDAYVRHAALEALARRWPDDETRELLQERGIADGDEDVRSTALRTLAEKWPDEMTRGLLFERVFQDPDERPRGAAFSALGMMHSEFGGILPTSHLILCSPSYFDPLEPIPREHIERAAEVAGIPCEEIDAQVASLSTHLGWDITKGAKAGRLPRASKENG